MWCWCANTALWGWVEKSQSPSQEQLAEEQSQHKMPKAKGIWPNVFDFISAKGLFSPPAENRQGLRPGAEDRAASYGKFLSTCKSFTRDFCGGGWGMIKCSVCGKLPGDLSIFLGGCGTSNGVTWEPLRA